MRRGPPRDQPFDRSILIGEPATAARALLGARLVREDPDGGRRVGRIVEVEAYGGSEDLASHARHGRTARNASMFGPAGHAYVYRIYGLHDCLNVVTGADGDAAAVLVRAVEPLVGVERMREARVALRVGRTGRAGPHDAVARLASGPGRLGAAFSVTLADDGLDLCDPRSPLRLLMGSAGSAPRGGIDASPRIGVSGSAGPWTRIAWRFFDPTSPSVSGPRREIGAA